jgi:hypothetical protein
VDALRPPAPTVQRAGLALLAAAAVGCMAVIAVHAALVGFRLLVAPTVIVGFTLTKQAFLAVRGSAPRPVPVVARTREVSSGPVAVAGYFPDPLGRHELRRWDGERWLDVVIDDGVASIDPVR